MKLLPDMPDNRFLSISLCLCSLLAGLKASEIGRCELNWQKANGKCYRVFSTDASGQPFTIEDARTQCKSVGADLEAADGCLPKSGCESGRGALCVKPFSDCAVGWYQGTRACYQLNGNQLSWDEAKTACNQMGADLIQITEEDVQKFVNGYLVTFQKQNIPYIWIGIYQVDRSKPLTWTGGQQVNGTYQNWVAGQPIISFFKRNAGRVLTSTDNGGWQIGDPTQSGGYICQLPLGTSPIIPTPDYKFSCPKDWQLFRGSCYLFPYYAFPWQNARTYCKGLFPASDLVDIRDAAEQEFVQRNLNGRDFWIGLHSKPEKWGEWYWNDDQMPATYYNWNDGEPNNANNNEYCVELYANVDAKWNDIPCFSYKSAACKRPADINGSPPTRPATTVTPKWDPACGTGWYRDPFSNQCYMINLEPMNWNDARLYCQSQRGDLASITSLSEKTLITGQIQGAIQSGANALAYWIGLNDQAENNRWIWSDGSPLAFINWNYGEPSNSGGNEDCVQILPNANFFWNDIACSQQFASVCKKPADTGTTIKPLPTTIFVPDGQVRGCPSDYAGYNNMCYRLYLQYRNWNDARQQCKNDGGDLVSMENKQEHEFVYELVRSRGIFDIWIGLHDTAAALRTMYFQWIDGSPVTFTYWNVGEPNDWENKENCVEQYSANMTGLWNDVSCNNVLPFVCKRREIAMVTTLPTTRPMGCPDGYDETYNGNCYQYVMGRTAVTWTEANRACIRNGGYLVTIKSSEEQGHLNLKLYGINADKSFWTGLRKDLIGFYWTDLSELNSRSYTNWATGANVMDAYGFMYPSGRAIGTWSMTNSITTLPNYLCKRRQDGPTTPSPPPTTYDPKFCAAGWVEADDTCYKGVQNQNITILQTWEEARVKCKQLGGDLASIHSVNATEALRATVVPGSSIHYWIGLNSRDTDQSYKWTDGSSPNYFNWKPNEPNNFNKKLNCILLHPTDMKWYVTSCSSVANYICETPKGINPGNVTTLEPTTRPDDPDCGKPAGWKFFRDSCYYIPFLAQFTDWYSARKICRDNNADLVSIMDDEENEFVHRQVTKRFPTSYFWIGLNELGQTEGFKWSDGSPVGYLNWKQNEPNNAGGAEHCVTMHGVDGLWNDDQCGSNMYFVCKRNNNTRNTDPPRTPMPGECPKDYYAVGDKCFRLFAKKSDVVTWKEAFDSCAAWGGVNKTYLASISTEYEQASLTALAVDAEVDMWIGLHTRQSFPRKYVWIDNSQHSYSNWDRGEPNGNSGNEENCVEMYSQKYRAGKWNDVRCESKLGYICMTYRQTNILTTWPGPQPTKVLCSSDWIQYGSACFKFYDQPKSWSDAIKQCKSQKADLASVHDVWEQNYLHSLTSNKPTEATWIGLSDQQTQGAFVWSDGWPVLYSYWGINQPNQENGPGCVRMDRNGKWFNGVCSTPRPYLCRISFGPAPTTPITIPGRCPSTDFVEFGTFCYFISEARIAANRKDFAAAQLDCKLKGGDLASINSPGEQDFLAHTIAAKIQEGVSGNFWIGMTRQLEDGFQWLDSSPVNYVHWAQGEPSDKDGSAGENCVEMYHHNFQWNDITCAAKNAYVCKVAKRPFTASTGATTSNTRATSTTTGSTTKVTQPPRQSSTTEITKEAGRTTIGQTGPVLPDMRNDLLVGGVVIGIILVLLALVFGVFMFRRQRGPKTAAAEAGFGNANWSKDAEAVTLDTQPRPHSVKGEEAVNPSFAEPSSSSVVIN